MASHNLLSLHGEGILADNSEGLATVVIPLIVRPVMV
jgi:hypothetical protein